MIDSFTAKQEISGGTVLSSGIDTVVCDPGSQPEQRFGEGSAGDYGV